jgi:hypothetical protein
MLRKTALTPGKKKNVTKRGFKSEKEAKATLNRMKVDFERGELQTMNIITMSRKTERKNR